MAVDEARTASAESEVARYVEAFTEAKQTLHDLTNGLTDDDFNWRPEADTWSIAECYDHLCMIGNLVAPRLGETIETAAVNGLTGDPPFKYGFVGNFFVKLVGPNSKRKFKAPAKVTPSSIHSISRVTKDFTELQDQFVQLSQRSEGLDLGRVKMRNPTAPILNLSLGQWFALIAGHQQRHFQQAELVKERMMQERGVAS